MEQLDDSDKRSSDIQVIRRTIAVIPRNLNYPQIYFGKNKIKSPIRRNPNPKFRLSTRITKSNKSGTAIYDKLME